MTPAKKKVTGRHFRIEWFNAHTDPPDGAPRVLCEVYVIEGNKPPAEFTNFPFSHGGGYSVTSSHVPFPARVLPQSSLASIRRKKLEARIKEKYPMFSEQFLDEELKRKPDYYNGITEESLQIAKDNVLKSEKERYEFFLENIDMVIIHAQEPEACKERSRKLLEEIKQQKAEFAAKKAAKESEV